MNKLAGDAVNSLERDGSVLVKGGAEARRALAATWWCAVRRRLARAARQHWSLARLAASRRDLCALGAVQR